MTLTEDADASFDDDGGSSLTLVPALGRGTDSLHTMIYFDSMAETFQV
jgi:hypothetical protein